MCVYIRVGGCGQVFMSCISGECLSVEKSLQKGGAAHYLRLGGSNMYENPCVRALNRSKLAEGFGVCPCYDCSNL